MLKMLSLCTLATVLAVRPGIAKEPVDNCPDRKALRQAMQDYEYAFNDADAKRLGACWTKAGQYVTASGIRLEGPDAIRQAYTKLFAERKGLRLETTTSRIQSVAPNVILEEGLARLTCASEPPTEAKFEAIHVKEDGQWKLSRVRETVVPASPSHHERLKDLQWMVGDWSAREGGVRSECEWTKNRSFLKRSFSVQEDSVEIDVTQFVGWDASAEQIRSWSFDSEGGFEQAVWRQVDGQWIVDATATLPDGRQGSVERILKPVDDNTFTWRSVNRQVDGRLLPSLDELTVVRTKSTSK